jgi:hypothetical protein
MPYIGFMTKGDIARSHRRDEMTSHTATFSNGQSFTKNSKRVYSHAVRITDARYGNPPRCYWAGSLELAQRKGPAETRFGYDAYEIVAVD